MEERSLAAAAAPTTAVVFVYWGQEIAADEARLASLRAALAPFRLYAICLGGVAGPPPIPCDRVVHLPLPASDRGRARAIGLQLAFNEGNLQCGAVTRLDADKLRLAEACFRHLAAGAADLVLAQDDDPDDACLFMGARAAFAASFWGRLDGSLAPGRRGLLAAMLQTTGRRGVEVRPVIGGFSFHALNPVPFAAFAPHAAAVMSRLGLAIGDVVPPRVKPVRKIAVVMPYYKEPPEELRRAIGSVLNQSRRCDLIAVSDGFPSDAARDPRLTHIELGISHGDNGNTPRYVGAMVALARGYDAVAFLDADNWFEPKHIQRLVERQGESAAAAVFSLRNLYLPDGTKVPMIDREDSRRDHVDTSCMLLTPASEYAMHLWGQMPQEWGPACDRVVFAELNGQRLAWTSNRTMNFKSNYAAHFRMANRPVPDHYHRVPPQLIRGFLQQTDAFRERAISRTGRPIRIRA